jgi:hypothetical protein
MTATTIIVSAPGGGGMVSSSQQIQNYNLFAVTSSANTFYGNQIISGALGVSGAVTGSGLYVGGVLTSAADGASITLKQTSTTAATGIYLERSGEQKGYYIYVGGSADSLTFQRNNAGTKADVMALSRDGDVTVSTGNIVIGTSGKGIDFSANSNAAGMTSELLNDYEEGTFTPILTFNGSSVSMTYSQQYGTYTKIGRHVTISLRIILTNKGSSTGTARIESLPFTIANINGNFGGFVLAFADGMSSFSETLMFVGDANSNYINLRYINGSNYVNFSNSNFTNTSDFIVTGTYQAS